MKTYRQSGCRPADTVHTRSKTTRFRKGPREEIIEVEIDRVRRRGVNSVVNRFLNSQFPYSYADHLHRDHIASSQSLSSSYRTTMARKSKDPRKPSQAFLKETGQLPSSTFTAPVEVKADPVPTTPAVSAPSIPTAKKDKGKGKEKASDNADLLRKEIEALGGDEEDWRMLKDMSDEEDVIEDVPASNGIEKKKKDKKGKGKEVELSSADAVSCFSRISR